VDLFLELAEATLYADDGATVVIKEFKNGKLTLDVDDIGRGKAAELTGVTADSNGVLVSASEDGEPVAVGFKANKASD
jgi:septum formation inhibitor-activating ATPase MinD